MRARGITFVVAIVAMVEVVAAASAAADGGGGGVGARGGGGRGRSRVVGCARVSAPEGAAVDLAAEKIYWASASSGAVRVGNLDGSGTPQNLGANYASESFPAG